VNMSGPVFEVVTPTASAAARRLTTAAIAREMIGSPSGDDTKLESIIDRISAKAARHCKLAVDVAGALPTFGSETVRATWNALAGSSRGSHLLLPWRVPVTSITSIVEDGVTLTPSTDYRHMGGGVVERLSGDTPICWSTGKIIALYVAGWALPSGVPPELEAAVIEQIKMTYFGADRDGAIRSETVPDVYQAQYNTPGGDGISDSGLLVAVESALEDYKNKARA